MKPSQVNINQLSESAPATGGGFFDMFTKKSPTTTSTTTPTTIPQKKSTSFLSKLTPSKPLVKIGGQVAEDRRMTMLAFNTLIQQMVPLQGDLCPQRGQIVNPFNNQIMPDLSCPGLKFGGRGGKKRTHKRRKNRRNCSRRY